MSENSNAQRAASRPRTGRTGRNPAKSADDALLLREQLCFALYSTMLAMNKVYRAALRDLGVTYPQYLVLLVLWENDALTVSQIGELLFLDSATLTPLLKRMEALGLIERVRGRTDERQVVVSLTDQGRKLKKVARAVPEKVSCNSGCTPAELADLRGRLVALRGRLFGQGEAVG